MAKKVDPQKIVGTMTLPFTHRSSRMLAWLKTQRESLTSEQIVLEALELYFFLAAEEKLGSSMIVVTTKGELRNFHAIPRDPAPKKPATKKRKK